MSAVSAVPATVRLPRTVGGRRALLTVLFLGGLFALAFFFGGSAQAATHSTPGDGVTSKLVSRDAPSGTSHAPETKRLPSESFEEEFKKSRRESSEATVKVTRPVAESTARTKQLTRPVRETVSEVVGKVDLGRFTDRVLPDATGGHDSGSDHGTHSGHRAHGKACDEAHAEHHVADKGAGHVTSLPAPQLPDGVSTPHATADGGAHDGAGHGLPGGELPFHDSPCVFVSSSTQNIGDDRNGPHGGADQPAAYLTDMERFGLLPPGAVSEANGTPTRDRSTEILEFPG